MKKKNIQWLYAELPKLVGEGVLSSLAAEGLREYYGSVDRRSRISLALIICSILGATLIGLGLILLFAHNWQNLSRPVRAVISFTPLIVGQILTGWAILRRSQSVAWREGTSAFLLAAIGLSIALISQTYHISSDLAKFLLTWMLLSLPLVYLLRASLPAVLYCVGITAWAYATRFTWGHTFYFWPLLALVVPHIGQALKQNPHSLRSVFLCWVAAACLCIVQPVFLLRSDPIFWVVAFCSLFTVFYLIDERWLGEAPTPWQRPFLVIGAGGISITTLILSFREVWDEISWLDYGRIGRHHEWTNLQTDGLILVVFLAAAGLWVDMVRRKKFENLPFGSTALLAGLAYLILASGGSEMVPLFLFNLYLLVLGVLTLRSGLREGHLGKVNGGLLLLSMLIVARFFDAQFTFTLRGIVFILIGTAFLVTNIVMKRRERAS